MNDKKPNMVRDTPEKSDASDDECFICLLIEQDAADTLRSTLEHQGSLVTQNCPDNDYTHLHVASNFGAIRCVRLLRESGADVNAIDRRGLTPLHFACSSGHCDVVKYLLLNGADPNMKGCRWLTPMYCALGTGSDVGRTITTLLLEFAARIDLVSAICLGNVNLVESCLGSADAALDSEAGDSDLFLKLVEALSHRLTMARFLCDDTLTKAGNPTVAMYRAVIGSLVKARIAIRDSDPLGSMGPMILAASTVPDGAIILPLLADAGGNINDRWNGKSCLDVARSTGNDALTHFLVERGAE